jgi:nitroimidazol reductase NimA-like FMN-containing flavoprotein (pyridoxamine 5'-phosphate oxidase superfamily)
VARVRALDATSCWQRLSTVEVGRLAVEHGRMPDIFPVSFVVDGTSVVFRTSPGSKATALELNPAVAFEADGYDEAASEAWSVVLKGRAEVVHNRSQLATALLLPLHPLPEAPGTVVVRVHPSTVTGRAFEVPSEDRALYGGGHADSGTHQRTVVPPPGETRNSTPPP